MTKSQQNQLTAAFKRIETTKNKVSMLRDTLATQIDDLTDILTSIDDAMEMTDTGLSILKEGVTEMRKFL